MRILTFIFVFCLFNFQIFAKETDDSLFTKAKEIVYQDPDKSLKISNELLKTEKDFNRQSRLFILISTAYLAKRDYDSSLKILHKLQNSLSEITDVVVKSELSLRIGIQYEQMELYSKSIEQLDIAEDFAKTLTESNEMKFSLLGKIYAVRGMIYKNQSNTELALEKFLISIKSLEKIKPKFNSVNNLSVVYYNMGYCYLEDKKWLDAQKAFEKSVEYAKITKANSLEAFAYKGLSEVYFINGNHQKALDLLNLAEEKSKTIGDLTLNEGIFKGKADNFLVLNRFEDYQTYNNKYLQTRFEREQSELKSINRSIENQLLQKENKINKLEKQFYLKFGFLVFIGFVMMVVLVILFVKFRKVNINYQKNIQKLINN